MMGTPANQLRLEKWSDEIRREFNILRARSHSIKGSLRMICDNYPDAHKYTYGSVHGYTKSPQGEKEYKEALHLVSRDLLNWGIRLQEFQELAICVGVVVQRIGS